MNPASYLQFGAMGLLAVVIGGFFWYVRSVEGRQSNREQFEREERANIETRRDEREKLDREERASHLNSLLTVAQIIVDIQKEIETLKERSDNQHEAIGAKLDQIDESIKRIMIVTN